MGPLAGQGLAKVETKTSGSFSVADQDNRMHRPDLYLDRLIASELDADLAIDRSGSQMKVSLILPRA